MAQWRKTDNANSAPYWTNEGLSKHIHSTNVALLEGPQIFANQNTMPYSNSVNLGIYGVANGLSTNHSTSAGWILEKRFLGPVNGFVINTPGTLYSNNDTIKVSNGSVNATANVVTATGGAITGFSNLVGGTGFFRAVDCVVSITTSTGSGANVTPTLGGGRTGRVTYETLVALGTIGANSTTSEPVT